MYSYQILPINKNSYLVRYLSDTAVLSVVEFVNLLAKSNKFREVVNQSVMSIPLEAFYFESVPMSAISGSLDFFWIAEKTIFGKNKKANPEPFLQYFEKSRKKVIKFMSPSGTILISPNSIGNFEQFLHLKSFCQYATKIVIDQFWKMIGNETKKILQIKRSKITTNQTWWLKTHGHAVDYLHFRIQKNTNLFVTQDLFDEYHAYQFYNYIVR